MSAASKMDWFGTGEFSASIAVDTFIFENPDSGTFVPGPGVSSYEVEVAGLEDSASISSALDVVILKVFG